MTKGSDLAQKQRTPAMTPPPNDPATHPSMLDPSTKKREAEEPHASPSLPIHDVAEGRTTPASASARSQSQSSSDSQADEDVVMQNLTGTRHAFYYGYDCFTYYIDDTSLNSALPTSIGSIVDTFFP